VSRSRLKLRAEMVTDGGAPRCPVCHLALKFGTDRNGRTTESCGCGYGGYLQTRGGHVHPPGPRDAP